MSQFANVSGSDAANNAPSGQFLFDTGAQVTVFSQETAAERIAGADRVDHTHGRRIDRSDAARRGDLDAPFAVGQQDDAHAERQQIVDRLGR